MSDTLTSLMWDKCSWGQSGSACATGRASAHTWEQAQGVATSTRGTAYKGYNDWRLPNVAELESLVNINASNPAIDTSAFPNTPSNGYWSSTIYTSDPLYAWDVYFGYGHISTHRHKYDNFHFVYYNYVRLVRSGSSFGSFDTLTDQISVIPVVEFYNTHLDNYFITANANEAMQIDNGSAGPGWNRTGNAFKSGGSTAVCRFYGSLYPGPNSHFYTLAGSECDTLKQLQASTPATQMRWNFESLDFFSTAPISGVCSTGTVPVYRAYNNGFARGVDSNHRITSSPSALQEVVARGWVDEGTVMCAPQ